MIQKNNYWNSLEKRTLSKRIRRSRKDRFGSKTPKRVAPAREPSRGLGPDFVARLQQVRPEERQLVELRAARRAREDLARLWPAAFVRCSNAYFNFICENTFFTGVVNFCQKNIVFSERPFKRLHLKKYRNVAQKQKKCWNITQSEIWMK